MIIKEEENGDILNKYLILVNRNHEFKNQNDYEIVKIKSEYANNLYLEKKTYEQFLKLKKLILSKGYEIEVESGYRSKKQQQILWNEILSKNGLKYTLKYVATPNFSEHQTGLAVDFCLKEDNKFLTGFQMSNKEVLHLVATNAHNFGFIIHYPKEKENITGYGYEPWHLRYVGTSVATYIYQKSITLEEYLKIL